MEVPNIASYAQIRANGASRRDIDNALRIGLITRVTRGWYALDGADPSIVRALRSHARLGCLSGCRFHGLWVPPDHRVHAVAGAGQHPPDKTSCWFATDGAQPRSAVWPLVDCLDQVVRRHSTETALIVVESALHLGKLTGSDVAALLARHGTRGLRVARHLSAAESGSETRVRLLLQRRRVRVTPQVLVPRVGRVDLLVGNRLIVECDSNTHHAGSQAYESDRIRDLAARDQGFDTLRLSYRQIWMQWPATRTSLLQEVQRRQHHHRR